MQMKKSIFPDSSVFFHFSSLDEMDLLQLLEFTLTETQNALQARIQKFRHHQSRLLEPLYIRFRYAEDITDFTIKCELKERNSSTSVRGKLLVFVDTMVSAAKVES